MNEDLLKGKAPDDVQLLKSITVGADYLTDFLDKRYLDDYILHGGSKIKFITGRPGSGKTHISRLILNDAKEKGYITVTFSAKDVWLNDFREIYLEILRQCDLKNILEGCAEKIIRDMGYDPGEIREGSCFLDLLSEKHEADAISKGTIRSMLREMYTKNPLMDNSFAGCCSLLTGAILGHPVLEKSNQEIIFAFMHGDKTVSLSQMRALGLSPARITKYNARHLLRSLSELIHLSGKKGLIVSIDDMEVLQNKNGEGMIRYTKLRREDTYESIRQLIDDIDSMRYIMFIFCFDRELMDNESCGLKSYQALWMRIQNEVVSTRFNCFADMIDLDRFADQIYTPDILVMMSEKLCTEASKQGYSGQLLNIGEAEKLIKKAEYGGLGLPYIVNRAVLTNEGGETDV